MGNSDHGTAYTSISGQGSHFPESGRGEIDRGFLLNIGLATGQGAVQRGRGREAPLDRAGTIP